MRGIDALLLLAQSRVAEIVHGEQERDDLLVDAIGAATVEGIADFHREPLIAPPPMFAKEKELLDAWHRGWDMAAELAEMRACGNCNDGTGNPCPSHG